MPKINPRWLLGILLVAGVIVVLLLHRPHETQPLAPATSPVTTMPVKTPVILTNNPLQNIFTPLQRESDPQAIRQMLAVLRKQLEAMPKSEAVGLLRRFLDSKADASTHLGFRLASNGTLDEAPTLRTFALDELARIDLSAAADYAKVILSSMDSPDEWAVALRSLALGDTSASGQALLQQKMDALLQYAPWQQNPSAGYLEAFDVAVYMGGTHFIPELSSMVQSLDNPAISHAAYLAMDRLVINNPATVLASLEADPSLMTGRESTRADYFARANVSDPQQRQVLESYLLNPSISPAELQIFAGIFPNANYMISPNLLTQTPTPDHNALVSLDTQSLAAVEQWLADPRFASIAPELQTTVQRLQGFVAQARK